MAAVLALLSAVAYGAGDFLGGLAARRAPVLAVVVVSQLAGLVLLLPLLALLPGTSSGPALGLGAAGGVAGALGLTLLYRGLASGAMSVVAPLTSLAAAGLPVGAGLISGERLRPTQAIGVALALAAIVLITRDPDREEGTPSVPRSVVATALAAGVSFGVFFIILDRTPDDAGLWPLLGARTTSVVLFGAIAAARAVGVREALSAGALRLVATCGALDMAANALYLLAVQRGLLAVVSALAALYPASTVLLAVAVLRERIRRSQAAGVAVAVAAAVLVAA